MIFLIKCFGYTKKAFIFAPALESNFNLQGTLAQMVEQWTENPCVPGSIPGGTTKKFPKHLLYKSLGNFNFITILDDLISIRRY